jgi:hypothetical protein
MSSFAGSQPDQATGPGPTRAETDGEVRSAQGSPDEPRVAAVVADELDQLAERPLAEHPEAYERIHSRLQESLTDIDDA